MPLNNESVLMLEEKGLQDLVGKEAEGKTLEFKKELFRDSDSDRKEFLSDVSSFANASGGRIIYGMEETQGIAASLPGIAGIDPDREKLRIENLIRDGIAPRLIGLLVHSIQLTNGNHAIVIHIPKSWASPHMVTYKGTSRFYARNSAGKYQMDVHEIRQSFLLSDSLNERIRNFRLDRLGKIGAKEMPVPVGEGASIVLHYIPVMAFQSPNLINMTAAADSLYRLLPEASGYRFNLDGLAMYRNIDRDKAGLYAQLFRNGIVEVVDVSTLDPWIDGKRVIPSAVFEHETIETCQNTLQFQQQLGINPPLFIFLTLLGVRGYTMAVSQEVTGRALRYQYAREIDRDVLLIPEVMVENLPVDNMPTLLRPMFDATWNAAGWPRSMNYDEKGTWAWQR
jgi:hypothetical protein